MRRWLWRLLGILALLATAAAAGAGFLAWRWTERPYQGYDGERLVTVRPGQSAGGILTDLAAAGVLEHARPARAYLVYHLGDPPLLAGEYRFDRPLTPPQVLAKLIRGEVVTYPLKLIEGLTLEETADALAAQGFGDPEVLRREMGRSDRIADLDPQAPDLEGYLHPDTYHFARGTSEAEIVATLVATFRRRFRREVEPLVDDGRTLRQLVTLASIVEKECLVDDERPLVAGVYAHRLRRKMALGADPTVIFALKKQGTWDGNLRRRDLSLDSPYNTYRYGGLPPGPICSPGLASLIAAAAPAETPYLYFVSRNDGTHVFARTLAEHNRNVYRWQKQYWQKRWARERRGK